MKEDGSFPVNHPTSLATEATFINQNFSQQTLVSGKKSSAAGNSLATPVQSSESSLVQSIL